MNDTTILRPERHSTSTDLESLRHSWKITG